MNTVNQKVSTEKSAMRQTNGMDEPAKEGGGCAHRKQRHSSVDCVKWALSARNLQDVVGRYRACQIHREADRKTDRCDSESLKT